MRAHFAETIPASPDSIDKIVAEPLETRIEEFKQDTKNMAAVTEVIEEVLQKAETEANKKQLETEIIKSQQAKEKSRQSFAMPDFKNGKVVNRARGFVVRIFDAICNCANNAAAAPTSRFKLRGKRQQNQDNETNDKAETLALNKDNKKKNENGKDKKKDDGKQKTKGVSIAAEPEADGMLKD